MPINLASPGIKVREVDLTAGRVDPTSDAIGGLVAPFARGPVEDPILIRNENALLNTFSGPSPVDKHYESWMVASSFLAYGSQLRVLRSDSTNLKNANDQGVSLKVKSTDDYNFKGYDESPITGTTVVARNPGSWANGVKVAIIDSYADQILSLNTVSAGDVGIGVSQSAAGKVIAGAGSTSLLDGYFKGIITGVDVATNTANVKFVSHVSAAGTETAIDYTQNGVYKFVTGSGSLTVNAGAATTSATVTRGHLSSSAVSAGVGTAIDAFYLQTSTVLDEAGSADLSSGATSLSVDSISGISTGADKYLVIGNEIISLSAAQISGNTLTGVVRGQFGTSAAAHTDESTVKHFTRYADVGTLSTAIDNDDTLIGITTTADLTSKVNAGGILRLNDAEFVQVGSFLSGGTNSLRDVNAQTDWFDNQTYVVDTRGTTQKWNTIAPRPQTSNYAGSRGSRFDEIHVVVIDGEGKVTGNEGTILEKHIGLSKASDAIISAGSPIHWRKYLYNNSSTIFAGGEPTGTVATGFSSGFTAVSDFGWDQDALESDGTAVIYGAIGAKNLTLSAGKNYDGNSTDNVAGAYTVTVGDLSSGYDILKNKELYNIDFLLMGAANHGKEEAQALANKLIEVAESRQDTLAFISPYRGAFLNDTSTGQSVNMYSGDQITSNILDFYGPISSSSYAIFDSGYKYMYDRFNKVFRYVPLNGDIAGLCARNDANAFPWVSPAGTARGSILNAIKLAYNPDQEQRDTLYSNRINPVMVNAGGGIILFGDKTGLSRSSAFDRINVRRLFIYMEDAISAAARDQLFEFNDEITRANFVNIIEPFLRTIQAQRGIFDFRVICDETNNTGAVVDNNEFVADIFVQPARSINFIGLNFVATRTGVAFEEVVGV
tara:strand:+ start:1366 stop:4032 length:2667 start_codon:yes stop_codon:yes gene_type:complete